MAKGIVCSGGEVVIVDDEDYPLLSRHKWSFTKYAHARLNTTEGKHRNIYMHQMIMGCHRHVDHKDGDTKNYQKDNLRHSTRQQNGWNRRKQKTVNGKPPESQYKGVSQVFLVDGSSYWRVIIKLTKKGVLPVRYLRINYLKSELEAAKVYDREVVRIRGEWAKTNVLNLNDLHPKSIGTSGKLYEYCN